MQEVNATTSKLEIVSDVLYNRNGSFVLHGRGVRLRNKRKSRQLSVHGDGNDVNATRRDPRPASNYHLTSVLESNLRAASRLFRRLAEKNSDPARKSYVYSVLRRQSASSDEEEWPSES